MSNKEKIIARAGWIFLSLFGAVYALVAYSFPNGRFWVTLFLLVAAAAAGIYVFKNNSARLKAERERAETAESHIKDLHKYIKQQDDINKNLQRNNEKFRHAAFHDALTNLPNRNQFIEKLKFFLERSKKVPDYSFAILYLDLNRFKTINESLGHLSGDKLILHVAKRLANCLREGDMIARFGGDEFAIILNEAKNLQAIGFADRIKKILADPFILGSRKVFTNASIGIAVSNQSYTEAENILRDADIAMCYAKKHGLDYKVFCDEMHNRAMALMQSETDLRFAVERNEFVIHYQPIIDLNSLTLSGFESLIRWNHPKNGMIPPVEFIPVSEENGLIVPITLWILRESCRQMRAWQKQFPQMRNLFVSVNLSTKHFKEGNLVQQVGQLLFDTELDPGCLKLEITESVMMENPDEIISTLVRLKSFGVQISLDDFGTGYSSLSYLNRFPIDTLKVDRSFVTAMDKGRENGEIVQTIISLAETLRMKVVAEGIETVDHLHQLRILGCHYGQGYLFSRPVKAEEAETYLADQTLWKNILPKQNVLPAQNQSITHQTDESPYAF